MVALLKAVTQADCSQVLAEEILGDSNICTQMREAMEDCVGDSWRVLH
jgi:hypothetical protein